MNDLFLGVDAGNTKTIAAVADRHGNILGWAKGGLGDIYGVDDPGEAVAVVLRLVDQAITCAEARVPGARLASAAFRLAGVDWPEDTELWNGVLESHLGAAVPFTVKNDGFALLRCGDPDGVGVAVSLGTGAAIASRGWDESEFAMSFWLQDPLGAAGLVDDALHAIFRAQNGLAAESSLANALPRFYQASSVEELLHSFTRRESRGDSHVRRSTAARTVLLEAERGDKVATGIVTEHAERVSAYVRSCAANVGLRSDQPFTVTLGGSVVAEGNILRRSVLHELSEDLPQTTVVTDNAVPILGTVLDALAESGLAPDPAVRETLLSWTE